MPMAIKPPMPTPSTREVLSLPPDDWVLSISPFGIRVIWDGERMWRPEGKEYIDHTLREMLHREKRALDGWWGGDPQPWFMVQDMPDEPGDFDDRWHRIEDEFYETTDHQFQIIRAPMRKHGFHQLYKHWRDTAKITKARGVLLHKRNAPYQCEPGSCLFVSFSQE